MLKRRRDVTTQVDINEDVVETGKSNNQTSIKQKIQTRGRGKVSKNPTLKDESEDESVKISNKKKEPIKKGRAKQANNKNEDTEPKQEREIEPKGKSAKTTKNKKEVENSESEKVSEPIKKKTTKKASGKNKDTESKPEKEVKPTLKRKAAKTIVNKKEGSESDNVSEPSEKPVKISRMKKPTGKNMDMEAIVEEEVKPAKRGKAEKTTKNLKEDNESDEVPAKKGRVTKAKTTKENEVGDTATRKNKTSTSYDGEDFSSCDSKNGKQWNFKISNWNVDGIRAWLKKGGLEYIEYEKPDILCLQETKCSDAKLPGEAKDIEGYQTYWATSEKDGYAGVGLYSRTEPLSVSYGINVREHDTEGRIITAEYEKFYVISVYVPNAGRGLVTLDKRLDWNKHFGTYIAKLDKKKPVIICGDMNVAHTEIDLKNPKTNHKNAGFTKEEREGMTVFLSDGYIDTFRHLYPDKIEAYTFWSYMQSARAKNIGWRLDYFIVSKRYANNVCDNVIRSQVFGSDHCPITLFLSI